MGEYDTKRKAAHPERPHTTMSNTRSRSSPGQGVPPKTLSVREYRKLLAKNMANCSFENESSMEHPPLSPPDIAYSPWEVEYMGIREAQTSELRPQVRPGTAPASSIVHKSTDAEMRGADQQAEGESEQGEQQSSRPALIETFRATGIEKVPMQEVVHAYGITDTLRLPKECAGTLCKASRRTMHQLTQRAPSSYDDHEPGRNDKAAWEKCRFKKKCSKVVV